MKWIDLLSIILCYIPLPLWSWGFFAHKQINRYAITTLPPDMFRFYKAHLVYLTEGAVNPDKRRYKIKGEAVKHFIDMEIYYEGGKQCMAFEQAVAHYGLPLLATHGQLPWAILAVHKRLTQAFKEKNVQSILKLSADLGHYVADAHVPLHTTQYYDGQVTGQEGIHALWETRLPVLFFNRYNLFVGHAQYISNPLRDIWAIINYAHRLVPTVLGVEEELSRQYPAWLKYGFEQHGKLLQKQYTAEFAAAYHQALQGQVEACLRQAILAVGNFWLTAWIDGGTPDLSSLLNPNP